MGLDEVPTVILDLGTREWRCGWAHDDGPAECPPAPPTDDLSSWQQQLAEIFKTLEVEPSEQKILVTERPGTLSKERDKLASILFNEYGFQAVCFAVGPLLALFNVNRDTCVIIDVGETDTFIICVFGGHAVFETGTVYPLAGANAGEYSSEAKCDVLFDPSLAGRDGERAMVPLHEAVMKTVAMADLSLRSELLQNIVLIGGGSRLDGFAERLQHELSSLVEAAGSIWKVSVLANADRRYAAWLGGAKYVNLIDGRDAVDEAFYTKAEYERDASGVHLRCRRLSCLPVGRLSEVRRGEAEAEAKAEEKRRGKVRRELRQLADEARAWWVVEAAVGGGVERGRQWQCQGVVREVVARWWEEVSRGEVREEAGEGGARERGGRGRRRGPRLSPMAALAFVTSAAFTVSGMNEEAGAVEAHLRQWAIRLATSALNAVVDEERLRAHHEHSRMRRALRSWGVWRRWRRGERQRYSEAAKAGNRLASARWREKNAEAKAREERRRSEVAAALGLTQRQRLRLWRRWVEARVEAKAVEVRAVEGVRRVRWRRGVEVWWEAVERWKAGRRQMESLGASAVELRRGEWQWLAWTALISTSLLKQRDAISSRQASIQFATAATKASVHRWSVHSASDRAVAQREAAARRRWVSRQLSSGWRSIAWASAIGQRYPRLMRRAVLHVLGRAVGRLHLHRLETVGRSEASRAALEAIQRRRRANASRAISLAADRSRVARSREVEGSRLRLQLVWERARRGILDSVANRFLGSRVVKQAVEWWRWVASERVKAHKLHLKGKHMWLRAVKLRAWVTWADRASSRIAVARAMVELERRRRRHQLWGAWERVEAEAGFVYAKRHVLARRVARWLHRAVREWKLAAELCRRLRRVKHRLAERLLRGLEGAPRTRLSRGILAFSCWAKWNRRQQQLAATQKELRQVLRSLKLRRGVLAIARVWLSSIHERRLDAVSGKLLAVKLKQTSRQALRYWKAEVEWRVERQNWVRCQVRYMHELQHMCDSGNGQRLARRLGNIGIDAHSTRSPEQNLNVIRRSSALYLRELERELKRVGGPGRLVLDKGA